MGIVHVKMSTGNRSIPWCKTENIHSLILEIRHKDIHIDIFSGSCFIIYMMIYLKL